MLVLKAIRCRSICRVVASSPHLAHFHSHSELIAHGLPTAVDEIEFIHEDLTLPEERTAVAPKQDLHMVANTERKVPRISSEMRQYLSENADYLPQTINSELLTKRRCCPESQYVMHKHSAGVIASHLKKSLEKQYPRILVESNSGYGLVTEEMLKSNIVDKVFIFESNKRYFEDSIKAIVDRFPNKIGCIWQDIRWAPRVVSTAQDADWGGPRFSDVSIKSWSDDPVFTVFIGATSRRYLSSILLSFIKQDGIMSFGRPIIYLMLEPKIYKVITATPDDGLFWYRSASVLCQLIFNVELVDSLSCKSFFPWHIVPRYASQMLNQKIDVFDRTKFVLVKLEPKSDFFSAVASDELLEFAFFVKSSMQKRSKCIITQLEKWIPRCGRHFVAQRDISIFTPVGSLPPNVILDLFLLFKKLPEYHDSPFIPAVEETFCRSKFTSRETYFGDRFEFDKAFEKR